MELRKSKVLRNYIENIWMFYLFPPPSPFLNQFHRGGKSSRGCTRPTVYLLRVCITISTDWNAYNKFRNKKNRCFLT